MTFSYISDVIEIKNIRGYGNLLHILQKSYGKLNIILLLLNIILWPTKLVDVCHNGCGRSIAGYIII